MERGKEDFKGTVDGLGYKGSMDDDRKVPLTLVWPGFIRGVARVLRFGARKYSRGNWMRGMSFSEVIDAMKRHIEAIERGEDIDPDSGEPHVDHIGCNAMFLDYYMNGPDAAKYKQFDDRLYKPVVEDAPTPDAQSVAERDDGDDVVVCIDTGLDFRKKYVREKTAYEFGACSRRSRCPCCSLTKTDGGL